MIPDPQSKYLRPLWARIAVTAVPFTVAIAAFDQGYVFVGAGLALVCGFVFRRLFLP